MAKINAQRALLPKCGAQTRITGLPCRNIAMPNGRCRLHGGATPKGDQWHKPMWPDPSSPVAMKKLNNKLDDRAKADKKRQRRLAAMTPAELKEHQRWQRTHKPGQASARAAEGARYKQDRAARFMFLMADIAARNKAKAAKQLAHETEKPKPPGDVFA